MSERFSASHAQERLWVIESLQPGTSQFNVALAWRLHGRVDEGAMAQAFAAVQWRHEALRTRMDDGRDGLEQVVMHDVRPLELRPDDSPEAVAAEASCPFDVHGGPLVRACLLGAGGRTRVLVITMHHLVTDGWSAGILVRELCEAYDAFASGHPPAWGEPPLQYADFAAWQRDWLATPQMVAETGYWVRRLEGAPLVLELPQDRPRAAVPARRGVSVDFRLERDELAPLRRLGADCKATLFTVLAAAFNVLLWRYSGQTDLCIGYPVAGRNEQTEATVGLFANTLVLRTGIEPQARFRDLVDRVRMTLMEDAEHAEVRFEKLADALGANRLAAHPPVFQAMLSLNNAKAAALRLHDLRVEPLAADTGSSKVDITLDLTEHDGVLFGALELDADLFDAATADRFARSLRTILRDAGARPQARLREIAVLDADMRRTLLTQWSEADPAPAAAPACIHELFERRAARHPDRVAVLAHDGELSYGELDQRADALARVLRRRGVRPEERVAVFMERGRQVPVALLGCLKAGAAYVPLDPDYPPQRLAFLLADCGAQHVVSLAALAARLPALAADRWLFLDAMDEAGGHAERPTAGCIPGQLAYCIYTSGSTGRPKGALNSHGAFVNLVRWYLADADAEDAVERVLVSSSLSFDLTQKNLLGPLMTGHAVVLPAGGPADVDLIGDAVARHRATRMNCAPSAYRAFRELREPGTLRRLVLGGEPVDAALAASVARDGVELMNSYGPTECADVVTSDLRLPGGESGAMALGRPLPGVRVRVLDAHGDLAPIGAVGELHLGGACVGRGYLSQPGLTAERFVPDPFGAPGERLYRTGDRVRFLADGRLQFLGRFDHQVKIRGQRLELGEIEHALLGHPAIRDAVVVLRDGPDRAPQLVAYAVPGHGVADDAGARLQAELRDYLGGRLPLYMVPAAWVFLAALPIGPHGKVDRGALPAPTPDAGSERPAEPPRDGLEATIAAAWSACLGRGNVSRHDNFFSVGGHSLLAVRLASRLRTALSVEVRPREIFDHPTIARLADALAQRRLIGDAAPARAWPEPCSPAPASFAQAFRYRRVLRNSSQPGQVFVECRLPDGPQAEAMSRALREALRFVSRRHAVLRTHFDAVGDEVRQHVHDEAEIALAVVPCERLSQGIAALKHGDAARRFDFGLAPLARAWQVEAADGRALLLALDHIIVDERSCSQLAEELAACATRCAAGLAPPELPQAPVTFAQYASFERIELTAAVEAQRRAFWTNQLAGLPSALPLVQGPRPARFSYDGACQVYALAPELGAGLHRAAARWDCSAFAVLHAAALLAAGAVFRLPELFMHTAVSLADREDLALLVGYLSSTVVSRVRFEPGQPLPAFVLSVRKMLLDMVDNARFPNEEIYALAGERRDESFGSRMQLSHTHVVSETAPAATSMPTRVRSAQDIALQTAVCGDSLALAVTWNEPLFDSAIGARMASAFAHALRRLLAEEGTVGALVDRASQEARS